MTTDVDIDIEDIFSCMGELYEPGAYLSVRGGDARDWTVAVVDSRGGQYLRAVSPQLSDAIAQVRKAAVTLAKFNLDWEKNHAEPADLDRVRRLEGLLDMIGEKP